MDSVTVEDGRGWSAVVSGNEEWREQAAAAIVTGCGKQRLPGTTTARRASGEGGWKMLREETVKNSADGGSSGMWRQWLPEAEAAGRQRRQV